MDDRQKEKRRDEVLGKEKEGLGGVGGWVGEEAALSVGTCSVNGVVNISAVTAECGQLVPSAWQ